MLRATLRARRGELAAGVAAGVVWQAAIWLTPLALGGGTDALLDGDTAALSRWVWVLVGLAVLETAATATRHRFACIPAARAAIDARRLLLWRLHRAPLGARRPATGDLLSRSVDDTSVIEGTVDYTPSSVAAATSVVAIGALLITSDLVLGLVALVPLAMAAPVAWRWSHRFTSATTKRQEAAAVVTERMEAAVIQARSIAGLGAGTQLHDGLRRDVEELRARSIDVERVEASFGPALAATTGGVLLLVLGFGVWRVDAGRVTVGQLVAAVGWVELLAGPLQQVGDYLGELRRARAAGTRVDAAAPASVLAEPPPRTRNPAVPRNGEVPALRIVGSPLVPDLNVPSGGTVAVVLDAGRRAALAAALEGREPLRGEIRVDGEPLEPLDPGRRGRQLLVVSRQSHLLPGSLAEVVLGPDRTSPRDQARAEALLHRLDDGALLAELGVRDRHVEDRTVSGGQRQRLALARALGHAPEVLVLDEATAALDPVQEVAVLRRAVTGRSTLLLTSRPDLADAVTDQVVHDEPADES